MASIQSHNEKAAALWGSGGRAYETISQGVACGILHGVRRLQPKPRERVVDIATGTGLAAREVARRGAAVSGVDIADGLLQAARDITSKQGFDIDFRLGDAESLPYDDDAFDAAISTFGIMFTADPYAAASELGRVVRPGGRVVIVAWTPESNAMRLRQLVVVPFAPPPPDPAPPPPHVWGTEEGIRDYLGADFDVGHELGTLSMHYPSEEATWQAFAEGFGPIKMVANSLEPNKNRELQQGFIEWCQQFRDGLGISIPADYLVTAGTRK